MPSGGCQTPPASSLRSCIKFGRSTLRYSAGTSPLCLGFFSEDLTESLRRFGNWIIFLRQSQQILRGERGQWVFSYLALLSNPSVPLLLSLFLFFRDQSRTIALFQGDIIIKTTSSAHCELALHSLLQSIFLVLIVLFFVFPHHEVALKVHCLANTVSHPEDGAKQPEDKVNVHLTLFL